MSHPVRLIAALAALAVVVGPAGAQAATSKPTSNKQQYYLSLGDSYAVGYQADVKRTTRHGFADQLVPLAAKRGYYYKLVNFGCGGATTTSILQQKGCNHLALAPGAKPYDKQTQIAATEAFLRKHKGEVGLVTVSISGNDVTSCARSADAISCVGAAVASIKKNVTTLAKRLRKAAGPKTRIVGTTYPDVILGSYLSPDPAQKTLAEQSVFAFKALINPALKDAYATAKGGFVDVTDATGAYGPLDQTTTLAPYGVIPVPVAKVCSLTFYCSDQDIHMDTSGYKIISELIAKTLPRR